MGNEEPAPEPLTTDPRVLELLAPCSRSGYYDRFVDDLVPILIEKLSTTGGDPLKRAKEELGALGERAARAMRRTFDEEFADASRGPVLENLLDAAALNDSDVARDLARHALNHPMESVRHRALLGIATRHAHPDLFEDLRERIGGKESIDMRRLYLRALFESDPARAEAHSLRAIERGERGPLLLDRVQRLAASMEAGTGEACARLHGELDPPAGLWVAAAAARFEDEGALARLREARLSPDASVRLTAVRCLGAAGRFDELLEPLRADASEAVRVHAVALLGAAAAQDPRFLEALSGALADGSQAVRSAALEQLCLLGDAAAIDLAVSFLLDAPARMQAALTALRQPMATDGEVARKAFRQLEERYRLEALRPLVDRATTLKAIGLVPLAEAAEFLHARGVEAEGEVLEGLRVHEWVMIHASNTGPAGRQRLWELLAQETDPLRRLDLVDAVSSTREDPERELLCERMLGLAEDRTRAPQERLYAAVRAIRLGPSWRVAPRLKRLPTSFEDPRHQVALQCYLWKWY